MRSKYLAPLYLVGSPTDPEERYTLMSKLHAEFWKYMELPTSNTDDYSDLFELANACHAEEVDDVFFSM